MIAVTPALAPGQETPTNAPAAAFNVATAALNALGGSPLQGRVWLDSLNVEEGVLTVDVRMPAFEGDRVIYDDGHRALELAIASRGGAYTLREILLREKVRWRVAQFRLKGVSGAQSGALVTTSEPLRWVPDGGPTDAPVRDSNDAMKRPGGR